MELKDNLMFLPEISAQFFSSVHVIFAIKYLHASIQIPLQANLKKKLALEKMKLSNEKKETDHGETEKKLKADYREADKKLKADYREEDQKLEADYREKEKKLEADYREKEKKLEAADREEGTDAIDLVEKECEAFEKTGKKRKRAVYLLSVLVPISLIALQLVIAPEKEDDRHDLAKYKNAYLVPSLTNYASFVVLVCSFSRIKKFLVNENRWAWNNKWLILHMVIFSLFASVLVTMFLVDLMVDDSYRASPAFDYFFMLY